MHFKEFTLEINTYDDLKISHLKTGSKENSPNVDSSSLFNSLLVQDINNTKEDITRKGFKEAIIAFKESKNETPKTSDVSNTHDELTLRLKLKNLLAS